MLEGRVAIVTGGGRGIGRAYAERLSAYGARVVVNDAGSATDGAETDEDPAADVVAAIRARGDEAVALRGDISSTAVGRDLCELAIDTWGRLDVVINNAGIGRPRMVFNLAEDEWDDVIRVHLKGTFAVSQPACRWWRAQAKEHGSAYGRIVNTATGLLLYGGAGQSNYVAAKAGIVAFTEAIATEMAPYGVTANAIMRYSWSHPRALRRLVARCSRLLQLLRVPSASRSARRGVRLLPRVTGSGVDERPDVPDPGSTIEHVGSWRVDHTVTRADQGWTAAELAGEMPRAFGAGAKRSDPPPAEWRDQYRSHRPR